MESSAYTRASSGEFYYPVTKLRKFCYPRVAFRLSCVKLNLPVWSFFPRPKLSNLYTPSRSKLLENHTLHSGTYLYTQLPIEKKWASSLPLEPIYGSTPSTPPARPPPSGFTIQVIEGHRFISFIKTVTCLPFLNKGVTFKVALVIDHLGMWNNCNDLLEWPPNNSFPMPKAYLYWISYISI